MTPPGEIGAPHEEHTYVALDTLGSTGLDSLLPTRKEASEAAFSAISYLLEEGRSQVLDRGQALQIAAWALKVAAEGEHPVSYLNAIRHQVLAELAELPENYG